MSLDKINLRKLIKLLGADERLLVSELRSDIRLTILKEQGHNSGGGDFHVPFWADAKTFVANQGDLTELTELRISKNPRRRNLYPKMKDGFLRWWNDKRCWSNEKFEITPQSVKAHLNPPGVKATIKVENLLVVQVGEGDSCAMRLIYPYFAENPSLNKEETQLGLWIMSQAFPEYDIADMRILDVLRGQAFGIEDVGLIGDEAERLTQKYNDLLHRWSEIRKEYPKSAA